MLRFNPAAVVSSAKRSGPARRVLIEEEGVVVALEVRHQEVRVAVTVEIPGG